MAEGKRRRTRKLRRAVKKVLSFGPEAKPTHTSRSGRTGKIHSVRLKSRRGGHVPPPGESRGLPVERCGDYSQHAAHVWVGPGWYPREYQCPGAR